MVSVILRHRNEEEFVGFAMQSIIDHLPESEVIVVNHNCTDETSNIIDLFSDRLQIRKCEIKDYTPGLAINIGVQNSIYDTILVLSSHAQITNVDFGRVKELLTQHAAVFGNQTPLYKGKKITKRYVWSHFIDTDSVNMFSELENRQFLHNAFCFYDRAFLLKYPMPEQYSGKEDRYWAANIVKQGYTYYYSAALTCNHFYTKNGATWKGLA